MVLSPVSRAMNVDVPNNNVKQIQCRDRLLRAPRFLEILQELLTADPK